MEIKYFFTLLKNKKQTIMSVVILVLAITLILTISQTFKYEADSRLIVIQEFEAGVDPYAVSRSNEYLSGLLASVVSSNTFFNQVMESNPDLDRIYFKDTINKQIKIWQNTVAARSINDTGIIDIHVFHPDPGQARMIINGIADTLISSHGQYHGAPNKVSLKILDEPIISRWPVKPNPFFNGLVGLFLGIIAAISYVYIFPEKKYDLKIWSRRKRAKIDDLVFTRPQSGWESIGDVLEKKKTDNASHLYSRLPEKEDKEIPSQPDADEKFASETSVDEPAREAEKIIQNGSIKNIIG